MTRLPTPLLDCSCTLLRWMYGNCIHLARALYTPAVSVLCTVDYLDLVTRLVLTRLI